MLADSPSSHLDIVAVDVVDVEAAVGNSCTVTVEPAAFKLAVTSLIQPHPVGPKQEWLLS